MTLFIWSVSTVVEVLSPPSPQYLSRFFGGSYGNYISSQLQSDLVVISGVFLMVLGFRLAIKRQLLPHSGLVQRSPPMTALVILYIVGLTYMIFRVVLGIALGPFSYFLVLTFSFSVASIYFIGLRIHNRYLSAFVAAILSSVLATVGAGTAMKENMLFPWIPTFILIFIRFPTIYHRSMLGVIAGLFLGLASSYVDHTREVFWYGSSQGGLVDKISSYFVSHTNNSEESRIFKNLERIDVSRASAVTLHYIDEHGHTPELLYVLPASLVPRALWPDKPVFNLGLMHTARLNNIGNYTDATYSTASGYFADLFMISGWSTLIIVSIAQGWFVGQLVNLVAKGPSNRFSSLFLFAVWNESLRFHEAHSMLTLSTFIFLFIAFKVWAIMFPATSRP